MKAQKRNSKTLIFSSIKGCKYWDGSPGIVVMGGGDSYPEGRGFESQLRLLDGIFFHKYLL